MNDKTSCPIFRRVLLLAPHTDDAELGCGGSVARFLEEGAEVYVAAFSRAEDSLPTGAPLDMLEVEFRASMAKMNVPQENVKVFNFPVRRFPQHRQEILDAILTLRKGFQPDAVFVPSGNDKHQDHQIIHAEAVRAFKDITIWGYELPWNHVDFSAQAFVTLESRHLERKWEALQEYHSQMKLARPYFTREFIFGLGCVRGVQVKSGYAEAYEVVRMKI
ncbi:MAG TPA: PIG-L deacetylase family protein [Verrucomicrobiales bacterium]|jgi:LmbE family N-acetylglucosaminyl deacetylase|nr:PIG-L deacetylase family protein [Verrucomicrobiales bacterium]